VPLAVIFTLCLGGIACFTPLVVYLFWLGSVNRRHRPTPVAGTWDFVALIAGLSGFLVCGLSIFLAAIVARSRLWGGHSFEEIRNSWDHDRLAWWIAFAALVVLFGLAVGLTLAARRRALVVYNTDLPTAESALAAVLADLGLPAKRFGNLWTDADGRGLVEVVPFHALHHVTFRLLPADTRQREELDRRLRAALAARPAGENPLVQWLAMATICLSISIICFVILIMVGVYSSR
jgi:hypothetical protein